MKKRLLIICSIIGVLLAGFQFPIYAEEDPSDPPSSVPVPNSIRLDQYFFDNYELLPYIESTSDQYINTQIKPDNIKLELSFSDATRIDNANSAYFFGSQLSTSARYGIGINYNNKNSLLYYVGLQSYTQEYLNYSIYNFIFDKNNVYLNNILIHSFNEADLSAYPDIYLFNLNNNGSPVNSIPMKLYKCSIYDYDSESFVRYYYPAKSKSSGTIGLYDAVSDTFFSSLGNDQFTSPVQNKVLNFQISDFVTASISWIGAIFEGINEMPIIWVFIAIGLAGVAFRWSRRIIHF